MRRASALLLLVLSSLTYSPCEASQLLHYQPLSSFHHLTTNWVSSSSINDRKCCRFAPARQGSTDHENEGDDETRNEIFDNDNARSPGGALRRNARPHRRGAAAQRTSKHGKPQKHVELSNLCPPLEGPIGAPPLPVLTTKDPRIIERWLEDNVGEYSILGFDSETVAKLPWRPERASLPDGPATIQLATPTSCIIVHLSRCGDGSALCAPEILRSVINNPRIIKCGVGIDDDALELYRWSKKGFGEAQRSGANAPHLWEMNSRFDLGCILPDSGPYRRLGLRQLAQQILGVQLLKSKKLSMSNWGKRDLDLSQISYAARDAWVAAAIVEQLQECNSAVFQPKALMEAELMKTQKDMEFLDDRATKRKTAKLALKKVTEMQKAGHTGKNDEEREKELRSLIDLHRPDQPPSFGEEVLNNLSLFQ